MAEFFKQTWVKLTAWILVVIGTLVLILGGTSVGEITRIPELVFGIVEAVGVLILAIRGLLLKKDATNG